ncbi:MAG: hypothetical protein IPN34_17230 [Planctomycetes bacterium]|nr:hypothetical protein [Planctomycetota bacterium]
MPRHIPADAFEVYYAMGPARSYAELARHYGVSKRAILKRATSEQWQRRIEEREAKVRTAVEHRVEETVAELRARHAKILKAITGKAVEALKQLPLTSAMDAVRALDIVLKQERLLHGEPVGEGVNVRVAVQPTVGPPVPAAGDLGAYMKKLLEVAQQQGLMPDAD